MTADEGGIRAQGGDAPPGLPASLAGWEDQASFDLFVNEERLGTLTSVWTPDGAFTGRSEITFAGQVIETTIEIVPEADGRWRSIATREAAGTRVSTRDGTSVTRVYRGGDRQQTTSFEVPAGAVLFDNDAPALASHALRLYDHGRGGAQELPLLLGGRPPVTLTLERLDRARRSFGLEELELTRFRFALPTAEISVLADEQGKVYLLAMPAMNTTVVRSGYAELRVAEEQDTLLSAPDREVIVESDVPVPMRDGLCLATDLYRPAGVERAPVVLVRTPYKKEMWELQGRYFARRGYVFAVQDCRGLFSSPGLWEPFVYEGKDGADTIEWLASQPFSSGKVGTIGGSYAALAQWLAAVERPRGLAAMIANVSPTDPFYNIPYEYGVFHLLGALWWTEVVRTGAAADASGAALGGVSQQRWLPLLRTLPVVDLDTGVVGERLPHWRRWIEHPADDGYWQPARFLDRLGEVDLPVFHQSGWFDDDGIGTKLNHARMSAHGHPHQKLTLGPWGHTDTSTRTRGERDFGPEALVDLQRQYLRWFDLWLKGMDNGIDREPLVSLFVMGSNRWIHGAAYPLAETTPARLYLASGGNANTSRGDGRLSFTPPGGASSFDRYRYDPGDPTPSSRLVEPPEENPNNPPSAQEVRREIERRRRSITEQREDILVYDTDPLPDSLTFAGPVSAVLYAASSAIDTDWFVTLSEVDSDGTVFPLVQGKLRARFRDSLRDPQPLEPHRTYAYTLDLWHTAIRVPAGARLRVEVASAAFPLFSRNLNTGGHNETETRYEVAEQTVYHDELHPSHVVLPLLRDGSAGERPPKDR